MTQTGADAFLVDAQAYRAELIAHCYRMVGSLHEAEDLVQETYLRAWRSWLSFEGRSSVRTWLYRIATNLCLTALSHGRRRVLPSGLTPGETEPGARIDPPRAPEQLWLEPFPDQAGTDPADVVASRASVRLAFVASLQYLPARQRAVFLLREVLSYPAAEVAELLDMSVAGVKSALQRARATMGKVGRHADELSEPTSAEARTALDGYIDAFERADVESLTRLLRADARLEVVPAGSWLAGNRACVPFLADEVLTRPGLYRMFPVITNGQPGVVAYRRNSATDPMAAFAVVVLDTSGGQLTGITVFTTPGLVAAFGFPEQPPD